jgi:hypothetical protein
MENMVKSSLGTLLGASAGLVLALSLASPAMAATEPPPPALQEWFDASSVTQSTVVAPDVSTDAVTKKTLAKGMRLTHKRGSFLLWTQNTLEWYWNASKVTSSTGWQSVGYVFPNTARKGGIKRTAVFTNQHRWRGTNIAGAGVVTPWGDVNVYQSSRTDYYTLKRGGGSTIE